MTVFQQQDTATDLSSSSSPRPSPPVPPSLSPLFLPHLSSFSPVFRPYLIQLPRRAPGDYGWCQRREQPRRTSRQEGGADTRPLHHSRISDYVLPPPPRLVLRDADDGESPPPPTPQPRCPCTPFPLASAGAVSGAPLFLVAAEMTSPSTLTSHLASPR